MMEEKRASVRRNEDRDAASRLEDAVSVMLNAQASATELLASQHAALNKHITDEELAYAQGQQEVVSKVDKLDRKLEDSASNLHRKLDDTVRMIDAGIEKAINYTKSRTEEFHDHSDPTDVRKNDVWTTRMRQKEERYDAANLDQKVSAKWEMGKYILIALISILSGFFLTTVGNKVLTPALVEHSTEEGKKYDKLEAEMKEIKELLKGQK